jgi:hypothetical protein
MRSAASSFVATGIVGGIESGVGGLGAASALAVANKGVPWVPAILKGAGAGAGVHVLDYGINKMLAGGDENSWYALKATNERPQSTIFQPNGLEALMVGASAALPIKDVRIKAGLIGASWLAGRIDNYVELKVLKDR